MLLTRSLAPTPVRPVRALRTSFNLGVVPGSLGGGIRPPIAVIAFPTDLRALLISGTTIRGSTPVGVAMTPRGRRVARNEERKILACILNKKGD